MEVLEERAPETKPPESGAKPKIVRNREVDKAAKELQDDYVLPLPPGKTLTWEQMQDWLRLLTPAMWSHVSCYLYRVKPKIRRQLRDKDAHSYIDCLNGPFALEYVINRHGGGVYEMQVTDTDGKRENNANRLFKCHFDINDTLYPPILDYLELDLEARENKSYIDWLKAKGELGTDGRPRQPQAPPSSTANMSAKEVLDILTFAQRMSSDQQSAFRSQFAPADSLSKSIGEILLEKMKQDDPGRDWDRMVTFMDKLHKPDNSMAALIQLMQTQITNGQQQMQAQNSNAQEQRKTDLAYLQMILDSQKRDSAPRNQLAELRDMISIVKEITGGGGGKRSGWETGLEIAREVGLPAIQHIGNMITNLMALRSNAAPVAPGQTAARPPAAQAPFDPYRNPGAARQYASTLPQQPPPQPQAAAAPPPDVETQLLMTIQQYGGLIQSHMNNGTPGYDLADYIAGLLGTAVHANICAPGEEVLATVMMKVPELALFGEARIRQFVNEFVHYQEFLEAAGGEEPPEGEEPESPEPEIIPPQPEPKFFRPPGKAAASTKGA